MHLILRIHQKMVAGLTSRLEKPFIPVEKRTIALIVRFYFKYIGYIDMFSGLNLLVRRFINS
jgi:hypothetical protein